jgi:hypothetical protein
MGKRHNIFIEILYILRIPHLLNNIRVLFGKPRKGYYVIMDRRISMNSEGIFLDSTLVFRRVRPDIYRICNVIGIDELSNIVDWLISRYNSCTPWTNYDLGHEESSRYYTISYVDPVMMRSICHLKVDSSFVSQHPGMFTKKVFVEVL